jgi:Predicted phosphohydrolases
MAGNPFVVVFSADSDVSNKADSVFEEIVKEEPHRYIFGGDGPYAKEGKTWTKLIDKHGLKPIIKLSEGNHDCEDSEDEQTEKDIESWMKPLMDLTKTPEVNSEHEDDWVSPKWIHSWQDRNAFFIVMNTEDNDIAYKRNQYNWVVKLLKKVKDLKAEGKVDWTFVILHKPIYTLKTKKGHDALLKVRDIYQPLFDKSGIDFVLSGHNHNSQLWVPMVYDATPKSTNSDGTYDFSEPHGQFYFVNGAGGHEINNFKEKVNKNKKVLFANEEEYCYTLFRIDGKRCEVLTKSKPDKILFSIKVTK